MGAAFMAGTDDSTFPLLRAIRAGDGQAPSNGDQRTVLVAEWVEKPRGRPFFSERVAEGERILARYAEAGIAKRLRAIEDRSAAREQNT